MCETGKQRKLGVEQLGTKTQKDATGIPLEKEVCAVCYEARVLSKVTTLLLSKSSQEYPEPNRCPIAYLTITRPIAVYSICTRTIECISK